jgi:transmembrane sensor
MSELADRLARSRDAVRPAWDDARAARVRATVGRRQRRRAQLRAAAAAAAGVALVLGAAWLARAPSPAAPVVARRDAADPGDATRDPRVTALAAGSRARWLSVTAEREVVEVGAGRVRFAVPHHERRVFRVEAGGVAVQVLGTTFTVERTAAGARVAVSEGRVRVFWGDQYADLGAGEGDQFPRARSLPQPSPGPTAEAPPPPPPARAAPTADALLEQADEARRAGQPERAAQLLRRALAAPGADANAAYTLGRVLRDDLRRPGEAAAAFARSRQLAPHGALSDDALAAEVECRALDGETARARALGEAYLRERPEGPAAGRVRAALTPR